MRIANRFNGLLFLLFTIATGCVFSQINGGPITGVAHFVEKSKNYDTVYFADFFGTVRNSNFLLHPSWNTYVDGTDFEKRLDELIQKYPNNAPYNFIGSVYINPVGLLRPELINRRLTSEVFYNRSDIEQEYRPILPNSLWSNVDTSKIKPIQGTTVMFVDEDYQFPFEEFLSPFYFRQDPVTNYEYRQFVQYVKDSIARELLFFHLFNLEEALTYLVLDDSIACMEKEWIEKLTREELRKYSRLNYEIESIDFQKEHHIKILSYLYYPEPKRFYKRKEIDTRKLIYSYQDEQGDSIQVPIYPDTLQFDYFSSKYGSYPMTNMYFWHPAYDDYPVVGVSFYQCQAFLHWKSKLTQKHFNKKGLKYTVTYQLPNEIQWDLVSTMNVGKKQHQIYDGNYSLYSDNSWITDLSLREKLILESYEYIGAELEFTTDLWYKDTVVQLLNRKDLQFKTLSKGYEPKLFSIYLPKKKSTEIHYVNSSNRDNSGNVFLGGIVSEWLDVDYDTDWKPIFEYRQKLLNNLNGDDGAFQSITERFYDSKFNVSGGKLVRGSNWYDERIGMISDKNVVGMHAKCFANPNESFATVGFRYVIIVEKVF
jgi:hypothetical protein